MVKVKICGITSERDAAYALEAGADAIGLVFARSPREVSVRKAARIAARVGPWTGVVGVFVNERPAVIRRIARAVGLTAVQLHGDETPADLKALRGIRRIKAFRISSPSDLEGSGAFDAEAYLFDTRLPNLYGGGGMVFDWGILKTRRFSRPVILSGGLGPGNVARAVRLLSPYGVDVSSGVERSPGKKDPKLIRKFVRNAKKYPA